MKKFHIHPKARVCFRNGVQAVAKALRATAKFLQTASGGTHCAPMPLQSLTEWNYDSGDTLNALNEYEGRGLKQFYNACPIDSSLGVKGTQHYHLSYTDQVHLIKIKAKQFPQNITIFW